MITPDCPCYDAEGKPNPGCANCLGSGCPMFAKNREATNRIRDYRGYPVEGGTVPSPAPAPPADPVNLPKHYTSHPSGVECITVTEHYGFNIGNAIKYLWRAGIKSENPVEDLKKAAWYVNREIARLDRDAEGKPK